MTRSPLKQQSQVPWSLDESGWPVDDDGWPIEGQFAEQCGLKNHRPSASSRLTTLTRYKLRAMKKCVPVDGEATDLGILLLRKDTANPDPTRAEAAAVSWAIERQRPARGCSWMPGGRATMSERTAAHLRATAVAMQKSPLTQTPYHPR